MARGVICQCCGVEAPSKYVEFHQNIGALVMRFSKSTKGNLCRRCIRKTFWEYTLITMAVGWLGVISFILAPIFIINNVVRYLASLGLEATPAGAAKPQLTDEAVKRLNPYADEIISRLNGNESMADVATAVARQAGVTPGQVVLFVVALSNASRQPPPMPVQSV